MSAHAIRRTLEQHYASFRDLRHAESDTGAPICEADAVGAFVVDDPADSNCPARRLIALGTGGLN